MDQTQFKRFIVQILRRATYKWKPRTEALKKSKIERNQYKCAMCEGIFTHKQVHVDHIIPVIDPASGFTNWDDYITRMFPDERGFQILCTSCHDAKTQTENNIRKTTKSRSKRY
jgi:5-methylcytosine-specific restriction endonuclease McrA